MEPSQSFQSKSAVEVDILCHAFSDIIEETLPPGTYSAQLFYIFTIYLHIINEELVCKFGTRTRHPV